MIIVEKVEGFDDLVRRYSDTGMMIRQVETGIDYSEAVDIETANYTYVETDIPVEYNKHEDLPEDEISANEAFDIIFGGNY